jgi:protein-serine/threonine kinase
MNLTADLTPPGSPNEEPLSSLPALTRFITAPEHASLPKNKSTSNLLAQRSPASLSVNTKRLSIDAGQLDRMAR